MNWPVATIGEVCEVVSGATPRTGKPEFWGGNVPWVTPKDLSELGQKHLSDTPRKITKAGLESCSAKMLPAQSVLFSSRAPIGLVAINTLPVCTNQGFKSLVPRFDLVSPDFLFWWLKAQEKHIQRKGRGATFKEVSKRIVQDLQLPLPPLTEQKRIAGILDAADALRAKRREALAQLDTLLQSTFLDMFGDPVTNPMGWEVGSLGDLAVKKPNNGVFRRNPEYSDSLDSGLPVVWVEELFRGNRIDVSESRRLAASQAEIEKYGLFPGDLLFCRSSLKLDGIAYSNVFWGEREEALFECHLIRVSPRTDIVNPMFLNLQLRSAPMRALLKSKSKTATMTTIDQRALSSVEVVVPPIGLQHRFAAIVESIEQQKASQRAHLAELDTLFASLQSRAFRGDL